VIVDVILLDPRRDAEIQVPAGSKSTRWLPLIIRPECAPSPPSRRTTVKSVIDAGSSET
jgi:hypothetical protein